ncbi:hypothetical protein DIPPA_02390 [Diplonema papillatum]|nr:hypothetical protein DIPPA_02390 [Diplonema papillatum]
MRGIVVALLGAASVAQAAAPPLYGNGFSFRIYLGLSVDDYPDYASLPSVPESRLPSSLPYIPGLGPFAVQLTGYLTVTTAGEHSFSLTTGPNMRMFIDGTLLINNGGVADVDLSSGRHEVRIEFFHSEDWEFYLNWEWQQPDEEDMVLVPLERMNTLLCPLILDGLCAFLPSGLGMHTAAYNGGSSLTAFPDFDSSAAVASWTAIVDFTELPDVGLVDTYFASRHTGYLTINTAGDYKFALESYGGSQLFIDGELVIADAGAYSPFTKTATTSLSPGQHEVRIEFFGEVNKPQLTWKWQPPGEDLVVVPQEKLNPLICPTVNAAGRCEAPPLSGLGIVQRQYLGNADSPIASSAYPDFDDLTPTAASVQSGIDIDITEMYYDYCCDGFAARYTAYLTVTKAGSHSFSLESGANSRMFIDGVPVGSNGGVKAVYLLVGQYEVRVEFVQVAFSETLQWKWQPPGEEMVLVPKERLTPLRCPTIDATGRCQNEAPPLSGIGLRMRYHRGVEGFSDYPDYASISPFHSELGVPDLSAGLLGFVGFDLNFASQHTGYLIVTTAGKHSFSLKSGNSSRMFIDGTLLINNGGVADVDLSIGQHEVRVEFFYSEPMQYLKLELQQPDEEDMVLVPRVKVTPLHCPFVVDGFCALSPSVLGMHTAVCNGYNPGFDGCTTVASWRAIVDFTVWPAVGLVDTFFSSRHTGYLTVNTAGDYKFVLESYHASQLFIDGELVIAFGLPDPPFDKTATTSLSPGQHEVRIEFFGPVSRPQLTWKWQPPGADLVVVPQEKLNPLICPTVNAAGRCEAPPLSGLGIFQQQYRGNADSPIPSSAYPDFDGLIPTAASTQSGIDIDGAFMFLNGCCSGFALRYTAYLTVTKAGSHSFSLESGISSRMFIDGVLVGSNGGVKAVYLFVGQYEVRVEFVLVAFTQNLQWKWQQPGEEMVLVPRERLTPLRCPTIDAARRCQNEAPPLSGIGLRMSFYRGVEGFSDYPDYASISPIISLLGVPDLPAFELSWLGPGLNFATQHTGYLIVTTAGKHSFSLKSGNSSRMFIDGTLLINNGGVADVDLSIGQHEVRVEFFYSEPMQYLKLELQQPDEEDMVLVPLERVTPLPCPFVVDGFCGRKRSD